MRSPGQILVHCDLAYSFCLQSSSNHHVPEGLSMFPIPWSSRWSWSLHLFLGRPMFLRPFGWYCSACFGSLFVSSPLHVVGTFPGTVLLTQILTKLKSSKSSPTLPSEPHKLELVVTLAFTQLNLQLTWCALRTLWTGNFHLISLPSISGFQVLRATNTKTAP